MRILILGGDGMLGHAFYNYFKTNLPAHDVRVTLRRELEFYEPLKIFSSETAFGELDVRNTERLTGLLYGFRPGVVINTVGIVKQRAAATQSLPCIELNALLPHRLSVICSGLGARLIHLSSDCIFSGRKGGYQENDPSDAEDLYGRTKYLGEISDNNCLTLRTSGVGPELIGSKGLLGWFLTQRGSVQGFRNAIYSGLTTPELASVAANLIINHPAASGLYQVSGDPINKYDLLNLFKIRYMKDIEIIPDELFYCDRSLDSSRFRREFGYIPPTWETMVMNLPDF